MPDSTHQLSDARPSRVEPILGTPVPPRAAPPAADEGWLILRDCAVAAGKRVDILALRAGSGIAILEVEPRWTPDALEALERTLAEAGFHAAHPGRLPIIHRRVPPESLPLVAELVAESFLWQPLPTIAPEQDWIATIRATLDALPQAAARESAGPAAHWPRLRPQPATEDAPRTTLRDAPDPLAALRDAPDPLAALRDAADPLAALRDAVLPIDDAGPRAIATFADLGVRGGTVAAFTPVVASVPATTCRTTRFRTAAPAWSYRFRTAREVSFRRS